MASFPVGDSEAGKQLRKRAGGRKGVPNKVTGAVKAMVLGAVHAEGGINYFRKQARENPVAFMSLLGKVLPTEIQNLGEDGQPVSPAAVQPIIHMSVGALPEPKKGNGHDQGSPELTARGPA